MTKTKVKPGDGLMTNFVSRASNQDALMTAEQILDARLPEDFRKKITIGFEPREGELNHYAQISLLGQAAAVFQWRWIPELSAFVHEQYRTGYVLRPGKLDARLSGTILITSKEDAPIKGTSWDVYQLSAQASSVYRMADLPDEHYLELYAQGEFSNGGTVLKHPAVYAYEMMGGTEFYIRGKPLAKLAALTKSYQRTLWRLHGYEWGMFGEEYGKRHKGEESDEAAV